jgi:DNA-binding CsgD family transcriptional regulator/tetratricopeptide (TPR) repeat protein
MFLSAVGSSRAATRVRRNGVGTGGRTGNRLYGRERELGILESVLSDLLEGSGGALVVLGQPGIGKSALLAETRASAIEQGIEVLCAVGVQSEARLPFAALHQLLRPLLDLADRLPARQAQALRGAFGGSDAGPPELYAVALATLELLSEAAQDAPLLLIVDDAQWLDEPSSAALAFVARRLEAEAVAMLIALRDGREQPFADAMLPELRVEGLDDEAAEALLDANAADIGPGVRERLLDEAAGNPLALVELPKVLGSEQRSGGALLPSRLPLTARLEQAFALQRSELPPVARAVLLVAAADDGGRVAEVLRAAAILEGVELGVDAASPAVAAGLLSIEGSELRFPHPLMRAAIYQTAGPAGRHAAHAALADVLAAEPDRRAWHRGAASLGLDEAAAAELDEVAARAERRGALAVAIRAYERAAELSEAPATRGGRLVRAAEMAFELGRQEAGLSFLRAAEPLELAPHERTRLSWLRATHAGPDWSAALSVDSFVELAERMRSEGHVDLASKLLVTAALRCWWGNADEETRATVVAAGEAMPVAEHDPALLAVLAYADPVRRAAAVIERIARLAPEGHDPVALHLIGSAASAVWAYDLALRFLDAAVDGLRAQGRLRMLAQALTAQAWAAVHLAREPLAVAAAEEAYRLAQETGQPASAAVAQLAQATIAAERGDFEGADALAREAEAVLLPMGATPLLALGQFVRGRGAVAHQRYPEGLEHHRRTLEPTDPAYHPFVGAWGLSDLVEAAAHSGEQALANGYLERLEHLAQATSGSLLQATAGYARPLAAADDDAEALYRRALERDLANWPCYRGRMLLWYGRWLRRQRRVADSRAPLRAALEGFDALAFPKLAESAREELRAAGETSRRRDPGAWDRLTPQELRIARLAAEGLSNREIGQRLFISHRTVGYHLHRIFPKLGITSRGQLQAAGIEPVE